MSSSSPTSAIFMTDTPKEVTSKINKYAFSGGRDTMEEHRKLGGRVEVDVSYQYLSIFLFDDEKLYSIRDEYKSGRMLSGEIKQELVKVLVPFIQRHQQARMHVTEEVVQSFMTPRPLEFGQSFLSKGK